MLRIRFQGGPQAGQLLEFGDDQERIAIGRDPARCVVRLPADDLRVGREHCELRRELGRYALVVNGENPVWVDNQPVIGSQRLPSDRESEVRLGTDGPILLITPSLAGSSGGAVLPPTAMHRSTPGVNTQLRRSLSSSRRSLIVAAMALLLGGAGIAAGVTWYDRLHQVVEVTNNQATDAQQQATDAQQKATDAQQKANAAQEQAKVAQQKAKDVQLAVTETQHQLDDTKAQVLASTAAIHDLGALSAGQKSAIDQLGTRLTGMSSELEKLAPDLADNTRQAKPSVYLVSVQTPDGKLRPCGTAWVCDRERGLLATNAHIGEIHLHAKQYSSELPDDCPLAVSSPGSDTKVYEVAEARIHPGYNSFSKLWSRYDPARPIGLGSIEWIGSAGPACDVAVLRVKQPEGLAPALKLADDTTLDALDAGMPLGFAGYPMDGLSFAGVVVNDPTPPVHFGYVTSVTDYFGASEAGTERLLIQHSVPTAGGASGSPLLNAKGEVVALHNASNTIGELDHVRVNTSANIHYGQSVSLLRELLGGAADDIQTARDQMWEQRIAKLYQPGRQVEAGWVVGDSKRKTIDQISQQGEFEVDPMPLDVPPLVEASSNAADKATYETSVDLPSPGTYLVAVMGQAAAPLELEIACGDKVEHGVCPNKDDPACVTSIEITKPGTLKITARGPADDKLQIEIDRFVSARQPTDQLHRILVERWTQRWAKDPQPPQVELVREVRGKLAPVKGTELDLSANQFRFEPKAAGHYLVSLVADDSQPMQLIVDGAAPGDNVAGQQASWLSVPIERDGPQPVTGFLGSKIEGLGFTLRLYRATEASSASKPAQQKKAP